MSIAADPLTFRRRLLIDADGRHVPLASVLDDWQEQDYLALDPSWQRVCGRDVDGAKLRAWLERPRGHSKTFDLAVMVVWALIAAIGRITGVAAAADRDQAKLLRDAIDGLVRLNPWLSEALDVQQHKVINTRTGSELQIISSDIASSYGLLCDFIVADEVTHWTKPDLWHSLLSTAAKRSRCLLLVITNAGWGGSWQFETREAIRADDGWYFSCLDGPQASWISPEHLAEQKRLQPALVYGRLWLNQWTAGTGDAFQPEDIDAALRTGEQTDFTYSPLLAYGAGLDLGLRKDPAALVIVGKASREEQRGAAVVTVDRFHVAAIHRWVPTPGKTIELADVERAMIERHQQFQFSHALGDPWQGDYLQQRLTAANVPLELYTLTDPNWDDLSRHTLNCFSQGEVALNATNAILIDELRSTRVIEKPSGRIRFDWPRSSNGHGDVAMAFCLALMAASGASPAQQQMNGFFDPGSTDRMLGYMSSYQPRTYPSPFNSRIPTRGFGRNW